MIPDRGCLADQTLAALVDGLLPDGDRAVALQHVDGCATCLDRVALLASLRDAQPTPAPAALVEAVTRRARHWTRRVAPYGAVAAGLLLAVAVWPTREPGVRPDSTRPPATSETGTVVRTAPAGIAGLVVEAPKDNERLAPGFEVRWQGPASAVFYEVQLTTVDGDLLWSAQVDGGSHHVAVPTTLSSSQPSYLWVTAHLPEGRRLTSNVIRVRGR